MNICITSWNRPTMLEDTIFTIKERTRSEHSIFVLDNNSEPCTVELLQTLHKKGIISDLGLLKENTGCTYPKQVFASVNKDEKYFVITDNDVLPPDLGKNCWLSIMTDILDRYPTIGALSLQLPPQCFQEPIMANADVVYCKAVGNTFKMIRSEAWPEKFSVVTTPVGDDAILSQMMRDDGWDIAFTRNVWCLHMGYGPAFPYDYDPRTYIPTDPKWIIKFSGGGLNRLCPFWFRKIIRRRGKK